jgi:hypothetical protein
VPLEFGFPQGMPAVEGETGSWHPGPDLPPKPFPQQAAMETPPPPVRPPSVGDHQQP